MYIIRCTYVECFRKMYWLAVPYSIWTGTGKSSGETGSFTINLIDAIIRMFFVWLFTNEHFVCHCLEISMLLWC